MIHMKQSNDMNFKVLIFVVAAVVLIAAMYIFFGGDEGAKFYKNSEVVAKVNGKPVYEIEADNIVKSVTQSGENGKQVTYQDLDENSKMSVIKEIATQRAMLKEADSGGIKLDKETKKKIYEYKNKLIIDQLLAKQVNNKITHDQLVAKYDEIVKNLKGKAQLKISHILVNSEANAKEAEERLKKEPFSKVAKELSVDGASKDKGGDLGFLLVGTMDPDMEKKALSLKVGEVSSPFKSKYGWHVIKLEDKRTTSVAPFENLKNRIAVDLYNEAVRKYAETLTSDYKIELISSPAPSKKEKSEENKKENSDNKTTNNKEENTEN